ncbi:hypothetical protein BP5796_09315 [Coleophoma crateriformis]|uniref:Zn(2)-C6 fungal-type domain-containing protein n=1 Tax=Coleophoma crateriformis TaxID=565419 RepID=A0A3D8R3X7_9HELO|nr:hypothetical protein BP5796_09315 [Coleophoma crateriformis]
MAIDDSPEPQEVAKWLHRMQASPHKAQCDESKPQCVNCTTSNKGDCTYPSKPSRAPKARVSDSRSPAGEYSASLTSPQITPSASPAGGGGGGGGGGRGTPRDPHSASALSEPVNITHLELFYHFSLDSGSAFFAENLPQDFCPNLIHRALGAPFLLYELLAVSALHLSFEKPEKAQFYREQAAKLQTDALRLYNEMVFEINEDNLVSAFVFAGMLGLHFFCDVFVTPPSDLGAFLDQLVQSIRLLQGVRAVFSGRWAIIANSYIKPLLQESQASNQDYTDEIVERLEELAVAMNRSPGLNPAQADVIDKAIKSLVLVYRTQMVPGLRDGNGNPRMVTFWPVMIPVEFTNLLAERKPEAIIVLAYFSILLHKWRKWWTIGASGQFLLGAVDLFLGKTWEDWLVLPKSIIYGPQL